MSKDEADRLLALLTAWAESRPDIVGLGLVGSWAYGNARPDSDLDLVILTPDPARFRAAGWVQDIAWPAAGFAVARWRDAEYGALWSRHLLLEPEAEVECGFAAPTWAATAPLDPGTRAVAAHALRPLLDPHGLFARLRAALDEQRAASSEL